MPLAVTAFHVVVDFFVEFVLMCVLLIDIMEMTIFGHTSGGFRLSAGVVCF